MPYPLVAICGIAGCQACKKLVEPWALIRIEKAFIGDGFFPSCTFSEKEVSWMCL